MRALVLILALAIAAPAFAQKQSEGEAAISLMTQQILSRMLLERDQANAEWAQRWAKFDAYLKACGDKPGCTVPVGKQN